MRIARSHIIMVINHNCINLLKRFGQIQHLNIHEPLWQATKWGASRNSCRKWMKWKPALRGGRCDRLNTWITVRIFRPCPLEDFHSAAFSCKYEKYLCQKTLLHSNLHYILNCTFFLWYWGHSRSWRSASRVRLVWAQQRKERLPALFPSSLSAKLKLPTHL